MSSSGKTPINSGPLTIRTYLDSSINNTYLLSDYDYPVSSNRILITSSAGLLAPSDNIYVSSVTVSTINGKAPASVDTIYWSLVASTIINNNPGDVKITSSLLCSSFLNVSSINDTAWPPQDDVHWSGAVLSDNIYNDNTGNVGINTDTPEYRLDVNGNFRVQSSITILGRTEIYGSTFFYKPDDPTISTSFKIELDGANFFTYKGTVNGGNATLIQNNGGGQLVLATNKPVITINAAGGNNNVGIGTTAPAYGLDVYGSTIHFNAYVNKNITFFSTSVSEGFAMTWNSVNAGGGNGRTEIISSRGGGTGGIDFFIVNNDIAAAAGDLALRIDGAKNVGIGTPSPTQKLDVNGNIYSNGYLLISTAGGTNPNGALRILSESGVSYIQSGSSLTNGSGNTLKFTNISYSLTAPLTVNTVNNRVGINNENPSYALDVVGDIYASGNITAASDIRFKTGISNIENPLSTLTQLRGVTYFPNADTTAHRHIGVIAQEVEKVLPEVVFTDNTESQFKSVAYGNIVGLLIEAVKELSDKINILENKINSR